MALQFPRNTPSASVNGAGRNNLSFGNITNSRPPVGNIPTPGNLLGTVASLSSRIGNVNLNFGGLLDPNIELLLGTFDQARSLSTLSFSGSNNLSINVRTPDQLRSTGIDRATTPVRDVNAGDGSKQPNALRIFNHYNYVITLGILSQDEFNTPLSYRDRGFSKIILQSGGGNLSRRHQVFAEQGEHAEYYIENLNIDAIVAPNPNTGVSLGTTIEFEVTEPYSMGKFTEALVGAAAELGFANFTTAPFCLRIDFQGWNDQGTSISSVVQPYYIPITFINVEFSVSNSGSRYQAKAIAASDVASSNMFNQIKTEIKAAGARVDQVLENSAVSVTNALNDRSEFLENPSENSASSLRAQPYIPGFDKYVIAFPTSEDGILQAIENGVEIPEELTVPEELGVRFGSFDSAGNVVPVNPDNPQGSSRVVAGRRSNPESSIYNTIKAYAITQINEIGLSSVNEETADGADQDMSDINEVYSNTNPVDDFSDAERAGGLGSQTSTQVIRRDLQEAQIADKARNFTFRQGTPITEIIENVLMNSSYVHDNLGEEGENDDSGTRNWFRIDTYTFIDNNNETEAVIGRKPRVYVYAIFPYEMDQAIHLSSGSSAPGTENLREAAIKEYNYIYTGKNEDVLDFNIDFNYAFLQAAYSDFANFSGASNTASNATASAPDPENELNPADDFSDTERLSGLGSQSNDKETATVTGDDITTSRTFDGGTANVSVKQRTAKLFHDRLINSHVDMLMAEMTIWGDPYFLPSINGNYVPRTVRRMLNSEGRMQYLQNEVMIIVNFLTPIDYRQGGALMEFAELEERFSGLYRVLTVRNTFNNGEFKQELKLVRRHGQTDEPRGGAVLRTSAESDRYDPYSSSSRDPSGRSARPVAGVPTILPQFSRVSNALGQVQGLVQSSQQIFQAFSNIMPPQVLNFQSQFGQISGQVAAARNQIDAISRSAAATLSRAGGAFASQTPSALSPTSSVRPQQRPINTQSTASPAISRPPVRPPR
jgi:hypothetical protein